MKTTLMAAGIIMAFVIGLFIYGCLMYIADPPRNKCKQPLPPSDDDDDLPW